MAAIHGEVMVDTEPPPQRVGTLLSLSCNVIADNLGWVMTQYEELPDVSWWAHHKQHHLPRIHRHVQR
jgi:hypothetical protein